MQLNNLGSRRPPGPSPLLVSFARILDLCIGPEGTNAGTGCGSLPQASMTMAIGGGTYTNFRLCHASMHVRSERHMTHIT
ncbi:unnamed protein product [Penicillium camemberti]|uniref:Str. FM013 n=1 Tax=Penicillium camemberti (strain FM 013) TaxID=1429867 RepID=A0A0G4PJS4_PENC3|nr:unnamed protein product [Penicillium camemberti]